MISFKTKISLFLLLAVVSFVGHNYIEQYEKCGSDILSNNWSLESSKSSIAEIKGNVLHLFSLDNSKSVNIKQNISPVVRGATLELSADIKCENVRPGVESWSKARLILMQYDREGNGLNLSHHVASLSRTRKWQRYSNYFPVVPETERIQVAAQLAQCTGSLWIKNIHLYPVIQTDVYTYFKIIILVTWGVYFLFLLGPCFFNDKNNFVIRIMLLLVFILIIIGISIPAEMKTQISDFVNGLINSLGIVFGEDFTWDPPKVGHFFFFFLLGLVFSLLQKHESDTMVIINILLIAGASEIVQLFIDGRSFLLWDVMIDLNGALYGFILSKLLLSIRREI
jgi:hypothetical protein